MWYNIRARDTKMDRMVTFWLFAEDREKLDTLLERNQYDNIEWVEQKYPKEFIVELTRHGNPKPGTDDMADSVVVALSHF